MTILDQIINRKKAEVFAAKKSFPVDELKDTEFFSRPTVSLKHAVKNGSGIIAEFKRQSPSKGIINGRVSPEEVVPQYEKFGASAASVLTDQEFFGGNAADIMSVRNKVNLPVLRKDFMIDAYQFYEAKSMGADAVLLIAACLSPAQVGEFASLAKELHLDVLLEIHTEAEIQHYCKNVDLVGINNRNLKDFKVDLQHSVQLKNSLPEDTVTVAESGIYSLEDFKFLKSQGFDGFLMGEFFMRNPDPGAAFGDFIRSVAAK